MWIKRPTIQPGGVFAGAQSWANAIINTEALNFATHTDWRVPNLFELMSICNHETTNPAINLTFFPSTLGGKYWASTTIFGTPLDAYYVDFFKGYVGNWAKIAVMCRVKPVRLGLPA